MRSVSASSFFMPWDWDTYRWIARRLRFPVAKASAFALRHRSVPSCAEYYTFLMSLPLAYTIAVVTGVSGTGKSKLVNDILYKALAKALYRSREEPGAHKAISGAEHIDKVIRIDQSPIGRTPRSNPATYTGVFTHIRDLYAMLPESRERGYKAGRFSFNVSAGRCEHCQGDGSSPTP